MRHCPIFKVICGALLLTLSLDGGAAFAFGDKPLEGYVASCLKGDDNDCNTAGYMYQNAVDAPQDFDRARDIFMLSCKHGSATGCYDLGTLYDYGQGVAVNYEAAAQLYQKACKGGEPTACNNLGRFYVDGSGVPQDPAKAAVLFRTICDKPVTGRTRRHVRTMVVSDGCNSLADLYERGAGVRRDIARAAALYQKACDLGNEDACNNLRILRSHGPSTKAPLTKKQEYSGDGPTLDGPTR